MPFIILISDEVTEHELYTFMEGYSGYNQVIIDDKDNHKTIFILSYCIFIYGVLSFGLFHALTAFQWVIPSIFFDLLDNFMSIFINDFSTQMTKALHLAMLCKYFIRFRQNGLALNPTKFYIAVLRTCY